MTHRILRTCIALSGIALSNALWAASGSITNVSVSRPFFNPSLGQKIGISFTLATPGKLDLLILDRDGYPVRRLLANKAAEKGAISLDWDGRDDKNEIVPDEAYSLKIDFTSPAGKTTYFPGNEPETDVRVRTNPYDRLTAVFSYKLPRAARVHVQAGVAVVDPKTKEAIGPVMRTLVNREPRPAGAVVESWNGIDEGGTVFVPDLSHFVMAVAATSLPDNVILTSGNRSVGFVDVASRRTGRSLFTRGATDHHHHRGLTALEDVAPRVRLSLTNAAWSASERAWAPTGGSVVLTASLEGPSAQAFSKEPGRVIVFVDGQIYKELHPASTTLEVEIPNDPKSSTRILSVNWASDYGPVAVSSLRLREQRSGETPARIGGAP